MQQKLATKLRSYMDKYDKNEDSPLHYEKRLQTIRATLSARDTSVSRYATCLAFVPEDKPKDAIDTQCITLKKASEYQLQAEHCWARYLNVMAQCKAQAKKKECYQALGGLDLTCSELATKGQEHLNQLFKQKEGEPKKY